MSRNLLRPVLLVALLALMALACNLTPLLFPPAGETIPTLTASLAASATAAIPTFDPLIPTSPVEVTLPPYPETYLTAIPTLQSPSGKIVYTCQIFRHSLRNQICLMRPDGQFNERLTSADELNHLYPSLAPDGQSVVYVANNTVNYQVYEQNLVNGETRQVTDLPGDANGPTISPDGTRLLFSYTLNGFQTLWVVNRDGSDARAFFQDFPGRAWDPEWSPDGSQVMFASDASGEIQLYVVNADGSGARQVTDLDKARGRSDWSADGRSGATYVGDPWQREIVLFGLDGSAPVQITAGGNNLAPSFSPDGQWIAHTSYRDRMDDNNGCEIYIMRVDGSQVTRLTDNDYCDWQPRWGN